MRRAHEVRRGAVLLLIGIGLGATGLAGCDGGCEKEDEIEAYADEDGDGYGGARLEAVCVLQPGQVTTPGDCDDEDPTAYPSAPEGELCDGIDQDCNGIDDGGDAVLFFQDLDRDAYGNDDVPLLACDAPDDTWARFGQDCDDTDPDRNPGASEVCNDGIDDDCDDLADDEDDSLDPTTRLSWYVDEDGDGYGRPGNSQQQCAAPAGAADNEEDCDDRDDQVFPGAQEVCNRIDDDCDGMRDDEDASLDPSGQRELFADTDGDGFGDPAVPVMACGPYVGVASDNADDCDDTSATVNPAANEVTCDLIDNDCDEATPDDPDRDLDGYLTCADADCDDLDPAVYPGAPEIPGDGSDGNCDGYEDCHQDVDGDGARTETVVQVKDQFCTTGYDVPPNRPIDCDDNDPTIVISGRWETDGDQDGYGDGVVALTGVCTDPGAGYVLEGGELDCDDFDAAIHPGADDPCNDGVDGDCDLDDECVSCGAWLASDGSLPSGVYGIRPPGAPAAVDVYCDMETDGGGWTLVASTRQVTLNDERAPYHPELATLTPAGPHPGVWAGLGEVVPDAADLRFACKVAADDPGFTVDLSFYGVSWYHDVIAGNDDADTCFQEGGAADPPPARRNNLDGTLLPAGDPYGNGALEGEDTCGDEDDFTVDFDDAGMDSNEADGTDWGEDDGKKKCGAAGVGEAWFLFVR